MKLVLGGLLFLISIYSYAGELRGCSYTPKGEETLVSFSSCALYYDGQLTVADSHLDKIAFDEHGLAPFYLHDPALVFYVNLDGKGISTLFFNLEPDAFHDGLARTLVDGKIGYFNRDLDIVIAPIYDWAEQFTDGLALVCKECQLRRNTCYGSYSVHEGMKGYIDTQGNEIVPVNYKNDAHSGIHISESDQF
uniref:WG repeat-containing protein n=1 Tax=Thaumasiovibrio occultus TaxID=1891184 RepID=UPI000B35FE45|nr:WG repeat-containing protein [Thaumasiovibrio occultus]